MNDPLEDQAIHDFVLESESNLDTATRVARVFPKMQLAIVQAVLDELERKIRAALGKDWEIWNNRNEIFSKSYSGFYVRRPSWGEIYVTIETPRRGEGTTLGVWRKRGPETATLDSALVDAFAKAKLSGEANPYWAWYQELPRIRGDWSSAAALIAMHFHRKDTVNELADQILLVNRIAAPVLDGLTKK